MSPLRLVSQSRHHGETAAEHAALPARAYQPLTRISAETVSEYLRTQPTAGGGAGGEHTGVPGGAPVVIALVLAGSQMSPRERCAVEFAARGPTVRLVPVLESSTSEADRGAGFDAVVSLGSEPKFLPGVPTLVFTDVDGIALSGSAQLANAVVSNHSPVSIRVADVLGSQLAIGQVPRCDTLPATEERLWRLAGPLLVMAASTLPLPAAPPAAALHLDPPRPRARLATAAGLMWRVRRSLRQATTRPPTWADPFVFTHEESTYAVVQERDRHTNRPAVRMLAVDHTDVAPLGIVLRTPHHLSTPRVYRAGATWWATVGTTAEHNPIYTFDEIGDPWRPTAQLPALPPHLANPTLLLGESPTSHPHSDGVRVIGCAGIDAAVDPEAVHVEYVLGSDSLWHRTDDTVRVSEAAPRHGGSPLLT